ncbi:hypothetical protein CC86DRAFT_418818 [Ophiobolus disseminans]|uniref:Uncharacterized protein n=1 Tax=Ophiobolus disseminans TaxID=1469910 RepID=A0A6A6ZX53_9PLEO|nr:hypothetical protein CC86DRAFT_418818 [Ophiobolus disseminans]
MTSILELPTELLTAIAENVQQQCGLRFEPWPTVAGPRNSVKALLDLCLTCSVLRNIAQSVVFRTLHIHYRNTNPGSTYRSLAQTLARYPSLAKEGRSIVMDRHASRETEWFTDEDGDCVGRVDDESVWKVEGPKLALPMLTLLSNVTTLHLRGCTFLPAEDASHLGTLLRGTSSVTNGPILLPQLRTLYISPEIGGGDGVVRIADYVPFLRHHGLHEVNIYCGVLLSNLGPWKLADSDRLPPNSLTISKMSLVGCLLDFTSACMLLEACSRLRSLSYSQLDNDIEDILEVLQAENTATIQSYKPSILGPQTLTTALESCKDTLEDLQIHFRGLKGQPLDANIKFVGLRSFDLLGSLTIQTRHMGNFSSLPPALKHLRLLFRNTSRYPAKLLPRDVADLVRGAADSRNKRCLLLQSVVFEGSFKKEEWRSDAAFLPKSAADRWVIQADVKASPYLVWHLGDVEFILRRTSLPEDGNWLWTLTQR